MKANQLPLTHGDVYRAGDGRVAVVNDSNIVVVLGACSYVYARRDFRFFYGDWTPLVPKPALGEPVKMDVLKPSTNYIVDLVDGTQCVGYTNLYTELDWPDASLISGFGASYMPGDRRRIRAIYEFNPAWLPPEPVKEKTLREKVRQELTELLERSDSIINKDVDECVDRIHALIESEAE